MLIIIKDDETESLIEFFNNKENLKNYILENLKQFEKEIIEENDEKELVENIKTELNWIDSEHLEQQNIGDLITLYVNALEKQIEIYDSGILIYSERGEY